MAVPSSYFVIEEAMRHTPDAERVADWIEYERHPFLEMALSRVRAMIERGDCTADTIRIVRTQPLPFTFGLDGRPVPAQ